jgi:hypothetical protein
MSSDASERTGRNSSVKLASQRWWMPSAAQRWLMVRATRWRLRQRWAHGWSLLARIADCAFQASPAMFLLIATIVIVEAFAGHNAPQELRRLPFANEILSDPATFNDPVELPPSPRLDALTQIETEERLLDIEIAAIRNNISETGELILIISTERARDPIGHDLLSTQRDLSQTRHELIASWRELVEEQGVVKERRRNLLADIDSDRITYGNEHQAQRVMFGTGLIAAASSLLIIPMLIRRLRNLASEKYRGRQQPEIANQAETNGPDDTAAGERVKRRPVLVIVVIAVLILAYELAPIWPPVLLLLAVVSLGWILLLSVRAWDWIAAGPPRSATIAPSDPSGHAILTRPNENLVRSILDRLQDPNQYIVAILFALLPLLWLPSLDLYGVEHDIRGIAVQRPDLAQGANAALFLEIVITMLVAGLIGRLAWHMLVIGWGVFQIGDDLEIDPGHRDKAGGLSPFGDLCWWNVLPIVIAATHLGGWLIVAPHISPAYDAQSDAYAPLYRTLLAFLVPFVLLCFLLPLYRIHLKLADYNEQFGTTAGRAGTREHDRDTSSEEPHALKHDGVTKSWPIDTVLIRKLVGSLTVPVLGLLGLGDSLLGIAGSLAALTN